MSFIDDQEFHNALNALLVLRDKAKKQEALRYERQVEAQGKIDNLLDQGRVLRRALDDTGLERDLHRKRIECLRLALKKHGRHHIDCKGDDFVAPTVLCTCGLDADMEL